MTQNAQHNELRNQPLVEHSVVLIAENVDPSIINPDFLRDHGIVCSDLETEHPPVSTPVFSQVRFKNGLTVTALPDRFSFDQRFQSTENFKNIDDGMESVKTLLSKVVGIRYQSIGVNMKRFTKLENGSLKNVRDAYLKGGSWMVYGNFNPSISIRASYIYSDRQITLEIIDAKDNAPDQLEPSGLLFYANIHRNLAETDQRDRIERMATVLTSWENDMDEFNRLVAQYYSECVAS